MLVNADDSSETFASGAGSDGRIERKHLVGRFVKGDAVGLELGAEGEELGASVGVIEAEHATAVSFVHGRFGRVGQSADACLFVVGCHAVDEQVDVDLFRRLGLLLLQLHQVVFDAHDIPVHFHTDKALLHVDVQLLHQGSSFLWKDRGKYRKLCSFREGKHAVHDVFSAMLLDQLSADGRVGFSHPCEKQAQVFIDLSRSTHRGAWVSARYLLFDGDSGRNPFDEVTFRLAHAAQELAGIRRKAFHIAPLSFRIQCVEGQGRLARTRQTGDDYQLVARNVYIDIFQIVDLGSFDGDVFAIAHIVLSL